MKTSVAFIIFKRPDTTQKVFEAIRQAKPPKLLIIADGPRADRSGEAEKCKAARAIIEQVDWDCEVLKNYSDVNLGCGKRVSSGLDWVFEQVEEAIILEDDCLPHPTFFRFCEELLECYKFDERIASISGQNVQFSRKTTNCSYYFSRFNHIWGWATWRRAWQHYDFNIKLWREVKEREFLEDLLGNNHAAKIWSKVFQNIYEGNKYTWDFQWQFACWINSSLGILPAVNLISNIGFGVESTHASTMSKHAINPIQAMEFPLLHPAYIVRNIEADRFTQKTLFSHLYPNQLQRLLFKLNKTIQWQI